jgi:hypothetical protein
MTRRLVLLIIAAFVVAGVLATTRYVPVARSADSVVCTLEGDAWVYNWQPVHQWVHTATLHDGRGFRYYIGQIYYDDQNHKWAYGYGAETGVDGIGHIRWDHIANCPGV